MMKIFFCCVAWVLISTLEFAQFSGETVFFTDSQSGFAAGVDWNNPENIILKTTNGGENWEKLQAPANIIIFDCVFMDSLNGYAVGEDVGVGGGVILRTTNGGVIWQRQTVGEYSSYKSICFVNEMIGYAVGYDFFQEYKIVKTTDAGITWIDQFCEADFGLNSVDFFNQDIGLVAGDDGKILRTTNGGEEWIIQDSHLSYDLNDIHTFNGNKGIVVGNSGIILRTADQGTSWTLRVSNVTGNLNSVFFKDDNSGFIVGDDGTILTSTDKGLNWETIDLDLSYELTDVHFPDSLNGYIVSKQSKLLRTTDGGINWNVIHLNTFKLIHPNGGEIWYTHTFNTIHWEVEAASQIIIDFSKDGGNQWETLNTVSANLNSIIWRPDYSDTSDMCLIRITNYSDSTNFDISDDYFSILPMSIKILSPNGGEVWNKGSTQEIKWLSTGITTTVGIHISVDNGTSWQSVAPFVPNSGSYFWNVNTYTSSTQCLLKIYRPGISEIVDISDSVFTINEPSSVKDIAEQEVPSEYKLYQNFPNPFNPSTVIEYSITQSTLVTLDVYNILGEKVASLINEIQEAGRYEINFDASILNSGIYFYKLESGNFNSVKKMLLMK